MARKPKTAAPPDAPAVPAVPDAPAVPEEPAVSSPVVGWQPVHVLTLRALEPVRADGVDYAPGDEFELDLSAVESLLDSGAAELA